MSFGYRLRVSGSSKKEVNMSSFTNRMMRAAKLDVQLYEEVEADKGALGQAMGVVWRKAVP